MLRVIRPAAAFAGVLAWASSALACPLCKSETGRQVRAGIFDADFGYNLLLTLLPFIVLLAVVALIHFGVPWGRVKPAAGTQPGAGASQRR